MNCTMPLRISARSLAACACLLAFSRSAAAQTIAGEVVDATTAQPLRAYQVRLVYLAQGDSTQVCDSTTTDERGLFQIGGQGTGTYRVDFGVTDSRLASSARVVASTRDTVISVRFRVPVLELGGAQAFAASEVQQVAHARTVVPLRYPKELLGFGVTGEVVVRFIVDPTGNVRTGSVAVLRSNHPSFTRAVTEALRTMKFDPARVGGIPVPQLVEQPFTFSILHAGDAPVR
jgi:TonB family protein